MKTKRLMMILGVVLYLAIAGLAHAGCPYCVGSINTGGGSLEIEGFLKGLAKNIGSEDPTIGVAWEIFVQITDAEAVCVNKGGNAEPAEGQPFEEIILEDFQIANEDFRVQRNGTATPVTFFSDAELAQILFPDASCPNKQWTLDVRVLRGKVQGTVMVCDLTGQNGAQSVGDPRAMSAGKPCDYGTSELAVGGQDDIKLEGDNLQIEFKLNQATGTYDECSICGDQNQLDCQEVAVFDSNETCF